MKGRSAHSLVALVLAGGAAIALVALSIGAAVTEAGVGTGNLSTESATLLSTALGAAIGAVATYLGGRMNATPDPLAYESSYVEPDWTPAPDTPGERPDTPTVEWPQRDEP